MVIANKTVEECILLLEQVCRENNIDTRVTIEQLPTGGWETILCDVPPHVESIDGAWIEYVVTPETEIKNMSIRSSDIWSGVKRMIYFIKSEKISRAEHMRRIQVNHYKNFMIERSCSERRCGGGRFKLRQRAL